MQNPRLASAALVAMAVCLGPASASTLAPPANLGELARLSRSVVFAEALTSRVLVTDEGAPFTMTSFRTLDQVGGEELAETFEVRSSGGRAAHSAMLIEGSPRFVPGGRYLLFLDRGFGGELRPRMLSFGLLREDAHGFLQPLPESRSLAIRSIRPYEPVGAYRGADLLIHLREVLAGHPWNSARASVGIYQPSAHLGADVSTDTANCAFLVTSAGVPIRWFGFETGANAVEIAPTLPGQAGIADGGVAAVQLSAAAWSGAVSAKIALSAPAARIRDISCDDGSAIELGDNAVIFDDPCGEISDLNSCSGVLAVGGAWFSTSTQLHDGEPWHQAISPFVVVNQGSQCIGETGFMEMMAHELGHGLGFGHHTDSFATMSALLKNDGRGASLKSTDLSCAALSYHTFLDVRLSNPFWKPIEAIENAGITAGCGQGEFCPFDEVSRAQMAAFLVRAVHGAGFNPPPPSGLFADVTTSHPMVKFIEQLFADGVTAGCATAPLRYCPAAAVTRAQMAVFLVRAVRGSDFVPPAASGLFADVSKSHPFADFIEQILADGITAGCSTTPLLFCPDDHVTRGQMAAFLTAAFNLPLP